MDIWEVIGKEHEALTEEFQDIIDYVFMTPTKAGKREQDIHALLDHLKAYFRLLDKAEGLDL